MRIPSVLRIAVVAVMLSFSAGAGMANVSRSDLVNAGMPANLADFASAVSSSEGNWGSLNQYGCAGAFQFCPATRRQYYAGSVEDFLASPQAQVTAYRSYMADQWSLATRNDFDSLVGRQVCWEGSCATITASSIIKGCQFGCAAGGALGRYYRTGDCAQARDGNGVSVCDYMIRGAGYDVSAITGDAEAPPAVVAGATTCFQREVISANGLAVSSPFGVDRTGRASAGYHLGLDLVNSAGRGDLVYAGVEGKVVRASADRTNSVFVETTDGRQRVGYLHGDARRVAVGDTVMTDTSVITMGDSGSPGAVHLHLEVHVSGDVIASLGEAAGRVWPLRSRESFFGSKASSGLSGASLEGAAPAPFYVVNPETYLASRVPFQPALLTAYADQGLTRPDGLTLEPTCSPSPDTVMNGGMASSNGGDTSLGGWAGAGTAAAANTQTLVNMAASDGRDAAIQYGQAAIGYSRLGAGRSDVLRSQAMLLAGLIFATEE